jgi:SAM-dependent methyltransferase
MSRFLRPVGIAAAIGLPLYAALSTSGHRRGIEKQGARGHHRQHTAASGSGRGLGTVLPSATTTTGATGTGTTTDGASATTAATKYPPATPYNGEDYAQEGVWKKLFEALREKVLCTGGEGDLDVVPIDEQAEVIALPDGEAKVEAWITLARKYNKPILERFIAESSRWAAQSVDAVYRNSGPSLALPSSLLDIGCGPGYKLASIIESFGGIAPDRAIGVDVFRPRRDRSHIFTFRLGDASNGAIADIPSGSIDLVMANMSMHHVVDADGQQRVIAEASRIVSEPGRVIIKEHDCPDDEFARFMDLFHDTYAAALGPKSRRYARKYMYRSQEEWIRLCESQGLVLVHHEPVSTDTSMRSFYAVFARRA